MGLRDKLSSLSKFGRKDKPETPRTEARQPSSFGTTQEIPQYTPPFSEADPVAQGYTPPQQPQRPRQQAVLGQSTSQINRSQSTSQINRGAQPGGNNTTSAIPAYNYGHTTTAKSAITLTELALFNLQEQERKQREAEEQQRREAEAARIAAEEAAAADAILHPRMEGEIINGLYRIDKLLAQGGMGQVFLATHLGRDNLQVVLKLLIKQADKNSTEYNRFIQEMLISGRMRHPNLIKVFDYGILLDGLKPYLVMEHCAGEPLRGVLRGQGTMPVLDAARVLIQACDALAEVHVKDIVHRDLKPENLMIAGNYTAVDNVKILDFGIAHVKNNSAVFKMDEAGLAVGSVGYMSPEQICAQPVDARTDIYSLGLIFYEAITGHPPFVGNTRRETMAMHVQAKHMPASQMAQLPCPEAIDAIVDKAMAKHPDARYQHVRELQGALQVLVDHLEQRR